MDPDLCKSFGTFQGRAEELRVAQEVRCDEENVFFIFQLASVIPCVFQIFGIYHSPMNVV